MKGDIEMDNLKEGQVKITLEAARKMAGLNLREAAKLLGIGYQRLAKFENNSANIPFELLKKMQHVYQVNINNIFLGSKAELSRKIKRKRELEERNAENNF